MEDYDGTADMKKAHEINLIGERWALVTCDALPEISQVKICERVKDICYLYAADLIKLRVKTDSCSEYLDDSPYNTSRVNSYEKCMSEVEKSLKTLINTYYDRLKQAETKLD
jgi:hypothetical protein